jgi:L-amino acid N-acyltransferase YncA
LRRATLADIPAILEINNHEILHSTINYDFIPKTVQEQQEWFHEKTKAGFPFIVAVSEEKVVGFASYGSFRPKPGYRFTVEHSLYLGDKYHGKNIGPLLPQELSQLVKVKEYHMLVGGIDSSNQANHLFHEKLDFT